jgi:hypothetical protein
LPTVAGGVFSLDMLLRSTPLESILLYRISFRSRHNGLGA